MASDLDFWINRWKVTLCQEPRPHEWQSCPCAHKGETALRRPPSTYAASVCPDMKEGRKCPRGDSCPMTHSLFEFWLHPNKFRTQMCDRGTTCNRRICFFAHNCSELRLPSSSEPEEPGMAAGVSSHTAAAQGSPTAAAARSSMDQQRYVPLALQPGIVAAPHVLLSPSMAAASCLAAPPAAAAAAGAAAAGAAAAADAVPALCDQSSRRSPTQPQAAPHCKLYAKLPAGPFAYVQSVDALMQPLQLAGDCCMLPPPPQPQQQAQQQQLDRAWSNDSADFSAGHASMDAWSSGSSNTVAYASHSSESEVAPASLLPGLQRLAGSPVQRLAARTPAMSTSLPAVFADHQGLITSELSTQAAATSSSRGSSRRWSDTGMATSRSSKSDASLQQALLLQQVQHCKKVLQRKQELLQQQEWESQQSQNELWRYHELQQQQLLLRQQQEKQQRQQQEEQQQQWLQQRLELEMQQQLRAVAGPTGSSVSRIDPLLSLLLTLPTSPVPATTAGMLTPPLMEHFSVDELAQEISSMGPATTAALLNHPLMQHLLV